ncbi:MAG: RNA polymerase sigma factor [Candidatus Helarchaeota archaeon]|nr:RNA polymerase sigma factor [Candidatus Helarchaeota archaeon]
MSEIFPEQEYISRFLSGDSDAFNFLVKRWQAPVYELAYRYIRNEQDAKDICQNTFIKAYKNLKKLRNNESFSVWIHRIAVNLCKDELKKRRHTSFTQISSNNEYVLKDAVNINPEFEENIIKEDIRETIIRVVSSLPNEQKEVLILKEYQGLKFREIAEILKISENTIKSRMYYALKNIKTILKKLNLDKEVS